jgi:hypothetical protein
LLTSLLLSEFCAASRHIAGVAVDVDVDVPAITNDVIGLLLLLLLEVEVAVVVVEFFVSASSFFSSKRIPVTAVVLDDCCF